MRQQNKHYEYFETNIERPRHPSRSLGGGLHAQVGEADVLFGDFGKETAEEFLVIAFCFLSTEQ